MYRVTKREGNLEPFDISRIENAIRKAFMSCETKVNEDVIKDIAKAVNIWDTISIEDIQDQIIELLGDYDYPDVAAAYRSYKDKQSRARMLWQKIHYMDEYIDSNENAATMSNTDGNANTSAKNVATLEPEVFKDDFRTIQRYRMKRKLKQMYPEVAYDYERDIEGHEIYVHDEASTPTLKQYCMAVSLYPLMLEGCGVLDKTTPSEPNDLQSFSGQLVNSIFTLSAQCKGAVACLYRDQPLLINGLQIKIKDLVDRYLINPTKEGDWEYSYTNGLKVFEDGKYVDVKRVYRRKYSDKIYKITSNKGFIAYTSKDHKFKVLRSGKICEVPAEELHTFDTVFVNGNIPIDFTSSLYKEGWIKGMLLGDGCLTQKDCISLSVNYGQEYYGDIFNSYADELYRITLSQCSGHECFNYEKRSSLLYNKVKEHLVGNNTYDKNIDSIDYPVDFLVGILDGLLCADGGDYHSIGISLVNKGLIESVMRILDILFIPYSYKEIPEHDNKSRLYHLTISTEVLKYTPNLCLKLKESKKVKETYYYSGWSRERNVKNKNTITSTGKSHFRFPGYKVDVITSIETFDNDDQYVYEIETDTHWYNCGGFITHNCGSYFIALNYYIIAEYGEKWYEHLDDVVTSSNCKKSRTMRNMIEKAFKQFVCGINQPAGNRGYQSPFTNISYYDHTYFSSLFGTFYYPDGTQPEWEAVNALQRLFMNWFNQWRLRQLVAFPVETMAMVYDPKTGDIIDKDYKDLTAEMYSKGHSFFTYISDSADSLASCCRLRNELAENTFSPTSGMTGIKTGSANVITLNVNRIIQNYFGPYKHVEVVEKELWNDSVHRDEFVKYLISILERVYKYHIAYKTMLYEWESKGAYASSNGGFINIKDLYSTIGINGLNEAARFLGLEVSNNPEYIQFLQLVLGTIKEQNKKHSIHDKKRPFLFNSECVPAESLGGKNYRWDKSDGFWVPEDENLYNSYFYNAHDNTSVLDKFILHGRQTASYCDGGSALHCNLQDHLSKDQYLKLINFAIEHGTNYFTFNIPNSQCDACHFITKHPIKVCPKCGSTHITQYTRIIGYLRPITAFGSDRKIESNKRTYSTL